MRFVLLAVLAAFGLAAYGAEPVELEPRVRVPAGSPVITVSENLLKGLGMSPDDVKAVKDEVARLNEARGALLEKVAEAKKALQAAQKGVDDAVAALGSQEAALHKFIRDRLAQDRAAEYDVRLQVQPVVDWLKLNEDQVSQLVAKQAKLLAEDPRPALEQATAAFQNRPKPKTEEEHKEYAELRKKYTETLKKYATFNQTWLANIESVLTDEQKQTWRTRYRRAAVGEGAAPAANE
ncbi:MAG TPA: hypothetical protein PLE19_00510 [Planctomycetota bacterium]|nr:hypothetical protein [Planctomycetota bacterium]HRR79256.1 hypothetical protein [Planctomycetota bacterium]HRT94026.1 hypothetical protein [Planctomycetota bacterium]